MADHVNAPLIFRDLACPPAPKPKHRRDAFTPSALLKSTLPVRVRLKYARRACLISLGVFGGKGTTPDTRKRLGRIVEEIYYSGEIISVGASGGCYPCDFCGNSRSEFLKRYKGCKRLLYWRFKKDFCCLVAIYFELLA